jgi:DNA-binding transcriptional LysR family regulator
MELLTTRRRAGCERKPPRARICGESGNIPSVLLALKSGAGLAPLPAPVGDNDDELVRVLGPFPELSYPMYLLTHRDLRRMPRVSAFFDFCSRELRPVLRGAAPRGNRAKSRA